MIVHPAFSVAVFVPILGFILSLIPLMLTYGRIETITVFSKVAADLRAIKNE
tara:strand:+ start:55 stop:210 length:156 start_codon:yes stop_codon:yes gene_type:complete